MKSFVKGYVSNENYGIKIGLCCVKFCIADVLNQYLIRTP
jgi:hypothetical protein